MHLSVVIERQLFIGSESVRIPQHVLLPRVTHRKIKMLKTTRSLIETNTQRFGSEGTDSSHTAKGTHTWLRKNFDGRILSSLGVFLGCGSPNYDPGAFLFGLPLWSNCGETLSRILRSLKERLMSMLTQ